MRHGFEIERKLFAQTLDFGALERTIATSRRLRELLGKKHRFYHIVGPDTYWKHMDTGDILRWRFSESDNQLTVKRQLGGDILIRREWEIDIKPDNTAKDTIGFIRSLGYRKLFRIYKACFIYDFYETGIWICLYDVWKQGEPNLQQRFLEIEAQQQRFKGKSMQNAARLVTAITGIFKRKHCLLTCGSSLFELYKPKETNP